MWSIFHTLKSQNPRLFMNFWRKGVMKRSVCFAFLPTYDGPMLNWSFFLSYFYCEICWNMFSRMGSSLLNVFQWKCWQLTHLNQSEINKHTQRANLSPTIFLKRPPIESQVKSTANNTWPDRTRWRRDIWNIFRITGALAGSPVAFFYASLNDIFIQ